MNIVPMATADLLAAYASRISEVERLLIAHSPVAVMPGTVAESAYLPPELQMKRYYAHLVLPRLSGLLRKGLDLDVNPEGFGLAVQVVAVELRLQTVAGWPGLALLMHRMLGDAILPWLPALFLAATALPGIAAPAFDGDEVGGVGGKFKLVSPRHRVAGERAG